MPRVDLDDEYEKFMDNNFNNFAYDFINDKDLTSDFENYKEDKWQKYQEDNELIDKSNI
jgi:hypothetical protein